jgi:DUF1365 family protein
VVTPPLTPALVFGSVAHTRHEPVHHHLRHRQYQWLVDLDSLPELPWGLRWLGRIDARDHLDGSGREGGIRGDLARFLHLRGVTLARDDRVLMLAHARVLGHVFDPLTIFWCLTAHGTLRALVFEVHNTYGGRHAYLVEPDGTGRARVDKAFQVSPFNDTSGRYDVMTGLAPDRVAVAITLLRDGRRVLTASSIGQPRPLTTATLLRAALVAPLMPQRVSVLIRLHGIRLWLRGLPVLRRPEPTNPARTGPARPDPTRTDLDQLCHRRPIR